MGQNLLPPRGCEGKADGAPPAKSGRNSGLRAVEDMRISGMGMRRLLARAALALSLAASGTGAWAADLVGQPTQGAIDLQPAAAPMKRMAIWFNNFIIMPVMFGIVAFVLILLLVVIFRFNKRANPT